MALREHTLQYYEAKIVVDDDVASEVVLGAYATIGTKCNMTDCDVKSSRNNCSDLIFGLTTPCYLIGCNNGTQGREILVNITTKWPRCPHSGANVGVLLSANNVELKIQTLAITTNHSNVLIPVIITSNEDTEVLSAIGVTFNVTEGGEKLITYSLLPHRADTASQSHTPSKSPFYYAILFTVIPILIVAILIFILSVVASVIWVCKSCRNKVSQPQYRNTIVMYSTIITVIMMSCR